MKTLKIIFALILLLLLSNSCSYYADADENMDTIENTQLTGDDDETDDGSKD